jgi:hypothetical protein
MTKVMGCGMSSLWGLLYFIIHNFKTMIRNILIAFFAIAFVACGVKNSGNGEDFERFYTKFHEDSVFQKTRIDFPLSGETSFLAAAGTQMKLWYADEWTTHQAFDAMDTLGYEQNMIAVDTMVVDVIYDNRAQGITRYFSLRDGKWYLTFYSDFNPVNPAFVETKK